MEAAVPNLLLMGGLGTVGMATNIPPHNLREVVDTVYLIDDPKATNDDLLEFVKGPDFPTGAIAFNQKLDIKHAYANGRGGGLCVVAEIVEDKRGH